MQNLSQTVFIVVEDVSVNDFEESPHLFSESHKIFENAVEVANPFRILSAYLITAAITKPPRA